MSNVHYMDLGFIFSRSGFTKDSEAYCREKGIVCSEDERWHPGNLSSLLFDENNGRYRVDSFKVPGAVFFILSWTLPYHHTSDQIEWLIFLSVGLHPIYIDIKKIVLFVFENGSYLFIGVSIESMSHSHYLVPFQKRAVDFSPAGKANSFTLLFIPMNIGNLYASV